MKTVCLLISLFLSGFSLFAEPEINQLRDLYAQSASSKKSADQLLNLLKGADKNSAAIYIGYKGAAEMMQAKYGFNPFSKYKSFKRGKLLLEEAVKKDDKDIEVRFLRFTIQTNLPQFLGYDKQVKQDKKFLLTHLNTVRDNKLKQNIVAYLTTSRHCSEQEKMSLKYE
ncbi:hypothetical protein N180_02300 [Pedobacter antarcticus 4BY]|uniref:DUF3347 domain-containing protein n=2 Tax=Pedobacter antarcticus TaxID=34086 RepID=A0A081PCR3_9SPHI|nr:hypothetical protein [Pedobacter antarcticus]KEQ28486.1 hypothetical protein N180_02300 [Pedobacter antarcticus 4BY]SFF02849.1 hypothetical protein SAMN03003324_02153 [Pedobacter antarcticus]